MDPDFAALEKQVVNTAVSYVCTLAAARLAYPDGAYPAETMLLLRLRMRELKESVVPLVSARAEEEAEHVEH